MKFEAILKAIDAAVTKFNDKIPRIQKGMLDDVVEQLRRLDLKDGKIKATVSNLRVVTSLKGKLLNLILTDDYVKEVKDFVKAFGEITKLQNEYWKQVESSFSPKTLLKEIRNQSIADTVSKLTEAGIGTNIGDKISDILRTNITAGGSYRSLEGQLRELLTNTSKSDGVLLKYTKQITTDSMNQYNAQYTQTVSNDLGFEFFGYQGTEIQTSRPFCQSMVEERRYFHISQVPALLRAENMYYTDNKDGKRKKVPIYSKTGLPQGFIEGTNAENFFVRRAGYQCGHQIRPVSESLVKAQAPDLYNEIINSSEFKSWRAKA